MKKGAPPGSYIPDPPGPEDDRFARAFKSWREWNTAMNFLTNLHVGAKEDEVFCLQSDPPDVSFREARFEVKEIMDRGRRRHDEAKAARARDLAQKIRGRTTSFTPKDLTPMGVGSWCCKSLSASSEDVISPNSVAPWICSST